MPKKSLQIFLILAFSFLLIPTSYWHHCEADHHIKLENGKQEVHVENGDCFICDFQFQAFESLAFHKTNSFKSYVAVKQEPTIAISLTNYNKLRLRGPPVC